MGCDGAMLFKPWLPSVRAATEGCTNFATQLEVTVGFLGFDLLNTGNRVVDNIYITGILYILFCCF